MATALDSLSEATGALKEATDRAEVAYRSLEYVAPKLAEEARRVALQAEDVLMKVAHAQEALLGAGL